MILPDGDCETFVNQIFRIFDKDGSGTIDFREFMLATDMTSAGTVEEKLKWAFKVHSFLLARKLPSKERLREFSSRNFVLLSLFF